MWRYNSFSGAGTTRVRYPVPPVEFSRSEQFSAPYSTQMYPGPLPPRFARTVAPPWNPRHGCLPGARATRPPSDLSAANRFRWNCPSSTTNATNPTVTAQLKSLQDLVANVNKTAQVLADWKAAKAAKSVAQPVFECPVPSTSNCDKAQLEQNLETADERRKLAMEDLHRRRAVLALKKQHDAPPPEKVVSSKYKLVRKRKLSTSTGPVPNPPASQPSSRRIVQRSRFKLVRRSSEPKIASAQRPVDEFFVSKGSKRVYRVVDKRKFYRRRSESARKTVVTRFKLVRVPHLKPVVAQTVSGPASKSRFRLVNSGGASGNAVIGPSTSSGISGVSGGPGRFGRVGKYSLVRVGHVKPKEAPAQFSTPNRMGGMVGNRYHLRRILQTPASKLAATRRRIPSLSSSVQPKMASRYLARSLRTLQKSSQKATRVLDKKAYKWRAKANCAFFIKHGYCDRNLDGSCPYLHDANKIAMCSEFLTQGYCEKPGCQLIHRTRWSKGQTQPVCVLMLRGLCDGLREGGRRCVLFHPSERVDVLTKRGPCAEFIKNGFCPAGEECPKLHVNVCQKFLISNYCPDDDQCPNFHTKRAVAVPDSRKKSFPLTKRPIVAGTSDESDSRTFEWDSANVDGRYFLRDDTNPGSCSVSVSRVREKSLFDSSFIPL